MRRIQATDCRTLAFPILQVFAALEDFERYPEWWPAQLKLRVLTISQERIGTRLEIRPSGGRSVVEVANIVPCQRIEVKYVQGVHRGTGIWTFEEAGEGTKVCYRIDLQPQGWMSRLLSSFVQFGWMHSRLMNAVFDGLEEWLSKQQTQDSGLNS